MDSLDICVYHLFWLLLKTILFRLDQSFTDHYEEQISQHCASAWIKLLNLQQDSKSAGYSCVDCKEII